MFTDSEVFRSYLEESFQAIDNLTDELEGRSHRYIPNGNRSDLPKPGAGRIFAANGDLVHVEVA